ncbi:MULTISPECIES: DUF3800 domain-containing protein [Halococcus]|uniref:DUF3800 domain-containing protein n=1 Tax=Halococcus TaxID=2249 RepID=UPI0012692DF4|nr:MULTISPECIES: DUF3800 domain-containing protein [Halococcus]
MSSLYVFVDESGTPGNGSFFTVAGFWCVSDRQPSAVLQSSKDKLLEQMNTNYARRGPENELKGSQIRNDGLDVLFSTLQSTFRGDDSIHQNPPVWTDDRVFRYTANNLNPGLMNTLVKDVAGIDQQSPAMLQTFLLSSILNPILNNHLVNCSPVESVRVVLDAETWTAPANYIDSGLCQIENVPDDVEFAIRDSKSTPGIQFADVAAYSWAQFATKGRCETPARMMKDLLLQG